MGGGKGEWGGEMGKGTGGKAGCGKWKVGENYTYKLIFLHILYQNERQARLAFYDMEQTMKLIFLYVDFYHFSFAHSAANVPYFWCFSMNRNDNFKAIEVIVIVCTV